MASFFAIDLPAVSDIRVLVVPAFTLAFIGTVQNITMAQASATKRHEKVNANRELIGLGAANLVAALFSGMPIRGGLSRSALNTSAGTPHASVVAAVTM